MRDKILLLLITNYNFITMKISNIAVNLQIKNEGFFFLFLPPGPSLKLFLDEMVFKI